MTHSTGSLITLTVYSVLSPVIHLNIILNVLGIFAQVLYSVRMMIDLWKGVERKNQNGATFSKIPYGHPIFCNSLQIIKQHKALFKINDCLFL